MELTTFLQCFFNAYKKKPTPVRQEKQLEHNFLLWIDQNP